MTHATDNSRKTSFKSRRSARSNAGPADPTPWHSWARFDASAAPPATTPKVSLIQGTDGDDHLIGTGSAELITGGNGNDEIEGHGGQDTIDGGGGNDRLDGGDGNDVLLGSDGNDVLAGGTGSDTLYGGAGYNTYLFGKGAGQDWLRAAGGEQEVLRLDASVLAADVRLKRTGDDLRITIKGSTDSLTVVDFFVNEATAGHELDLIQFADGTRWGLNTLRSKVLAGSAAADTLTGYASADRITGLDGDDLIHGRSGNDTLEGGDGNDQLFGDQGDDLIFDGRGNDRLDGGAGNDRLHADEGDDTLFGGSGADDLQVAGNGHSLVHGGDGNDTISASGSGHHVVDGDAGDDSINVEYGRHEVFGSDGNDRLNTSYTELARLDGGAGNDTITGWFSNSITVFGRGDGHDAIDTLFQGEHSIEFKKGITTTDVQLRRNADDDLVIQLKGSDDSVTVYGYYTYLSKAAYAISSIHFTEGGVTWTIADIAREIIAGTEGDDVLYSDYDGPVIRGLGGNDELHGTLAAETLDGGTGNDTLYGEIGSDTYVFDHGYGHDVIAPLDFSFDTGHAPDKIKLGDSVSTDEVVLQRIAHSDDLLLSLAGSSDSLLIQHYYAGSLAGDQYTEIDFGDGLTWNFDEVKRRISSQPVASGSAAAHSAATLQGQAETLVSAMSVFAPSAASDLLVMNTWATAPVWAANAR